MSSDVVNKVGAAVVEGCSTPYDKGKPENLRAMFRGDRCVGAWDVSADEVAREEDEEGGSLHQSYPRRAHPCRL